jgi:hypothetical protein
MIDLKIMDVLHVERLLPDTWPRHVYVTQLCPFGRYCSATGFFW